jgi:hypothetical protein
VGLGVGLGLGVPALLGAAYAMSRRAPHGGSAKKNGSSAPQAEFIALHASDADLDAQYSAM